MSVRFARDRDEWSFFFRIPDAGTPGQGKAFAKSLERPCIKPDEIRLIVVTHAHFDHAGSAKLTASEES